MKVIVTGGTGLVGRDIVRRLLRQGNVELVLVSRHQPPSQTGRVTWIQHDLSSGQQIPDRLFDGVDYLVHGAAHLAHASGGDYLAAARLNFSATTELYAKAINSGVRKIVYLSGLNFLRRPLNPSIDEAHPVGPDTPYAIGKIWGELALSSLLEGSKTVPVALRITSPIPRNVAELHDTVLRRWILAARAGEPLVVFGRGSRCQDYVSTQDIAEAIWGSLNGDGCGIFNIASGTPTSNAEVARLIAARYDVPVEHRGVDAQEHDVWNVSIDRARKILGYNPSMSSLDAIRALISANG